MMDGHARYLDLSKPELKKALDLVQELRAHCQEHELPKTLVLGGVAWDVDAVVRPEREKAYLEGKAYEKDRIAILLGVA